MELIKEPNPAFDKQLFLQSLYKMDKPVQFKVLAGFWYAPWCNKA